MIDHRKLQRALFRIQLDASLAERVFARDEDALESLGLDEGELALLLEADPVAVRADPGQQRRAQLIGNLTTEYSRSVWALDQDPHAFVESDEFHDALAYDEPLPLAFGAWLVSLVPDSSELSGLVDLEREMARARRSERTLPAAGEGDVLLAPACRLLSMPVGTHEWATAIGVALEAGRTPTVASVDRTSSEFVLIQTGEPGVSGRRDVTVELLESAVAELLDRAHMPFGPAARADFAEAAGASTAELEGFVQSLLDDQVLIAGPTGSL